MMKTTPQTTTKEPETRQKPNDETFYRILILPQNGSQFQGFRASFYRIFGKDAGLTVISRGAELMKDCQKIHAIGKDYENFVYKLLIIEEKAYAGAFRYAPARIDGETDIIY